MGPMQFSLSVADWGKLTPDQQAQRCHQIANEVRQLAPVSGLLRTRYFNLAQSLEHLAAQIERASN